MTKRIATLLSMVILTACQSVPPPLIPPGQLFPGSFITSEPLILKAGGKLLLLGKE